MTKLSGSLAALLLVACSAAAHADFTYTETTQITGGSILKIMKVAGAFSKAARQAGEPIVSTVIVKGNRMTRVGPQRTEIIDLDGETITSIDHEKRQYTVMTFEQMRQQIEKAMQKAKEEQKTKSPEQDAAASNTDVKFNVHVRDTGATKDVAGLNANESILTMAMDATDKTTGRTGSMAITNDLWLAPEISGYDEVKDFYRRYAEKMKMVFTGALNPAMLAQYPGAGQGMADMMKEMSKLKGVPVLQVMRMGTTADGAPLPAASEAPLPASDGPAMPSAGDVAQDAAQQSAASAIASKMGSLGGLAGGFGGFGHKKKKAEPKPDPEPEQAAAPATAAVLIESNTQLSGFSQAAADESKFDIPAGYKQVQPKNLD
ncbi:MAG: hypothetical protein BGO25_16425 [Acidobacteriales bacterium 59-55]|nr:hypothetical protein [Terriglobales bacterium]OJV42081.1 MAG: hypothetical protein BGO25_16425 [Acidobacteriales bacterium 59-55]